MRVRRAPGRPSAAPCGGDLPALVRLEEVFPGDRVSRASFARFIDGATADVWVAELAAPSSATPS
jgi:hypothetical protein